MNYPFWDVPLIGGGMLIGAVAILHVFVSHFAIGGGLYLVLTERKARAENDAGLLAFCKQHSRFFILVVLVFGAVGGAGIWWTIGLVNPTATSALIHLFVWAWAIEWVFFFVELMAAMIYYYGWDKLSASVHLKIGWIYVAAAWLSLVMINGILTFMLTSGRWPETRSIADAFFNPGMLPSLIIRTAVCVALAGLYALITGSVLADMALRARVVRYSAKWVLAGTAVLPFAGAWYIAELPKMAREISMGGAPTVTIFAGASVAFSGLLVAATFFGPYLFPKNFHVTFAFVLAVIGLGATGVTEWVREAVRKPYIIHDYMYSNSIRPDQMENIAINGLTATAKWALLTPADRADKMTLGHTVFRLQCQSCHTVNGFNGIKFAVKGWNKEFLDHQVQYLNTLKGYMPPFVGSDDEQEALVTWLLSLNQEPQKLSAVTRSTEVQR